MWKSVRRRFIRQHQEDIKNNFLINNIAKYTPVSEAMMEIGSERVISASLRWHADCITAESGGQGSNVNTVAAAINKTDTCLITPRILWVSFCRYLEGFHLQMINTLPPCHHGTAVVAGSKCELRSFTDEAPATWRACCVWTGLVWPSIVLCALSVSWRWTPAPCSKNEWILRHCLIDLQKPSPTRPSTPRPSCSKAQPCRPTTFWPAPASSTSTRASSSRFLSAPSTWSTGSSIWPRTQWRCPGECGKLIGGPLEQTTGEWGNKKIGDRICTSLTWEQNTVTKLWWFKNGSKWARACPTYIYRKRI